jgi:2-keto-4-pentenoate hydratase/2-oxohepta-3-ene-1,7-dioic acid hydratase in catechol pathway
MEGNLKLAKFKHDDSAHIGLVVPDGVIDATGALPGFPLDMQTLIAEFDFWRDALEDLSGRKATFLRTEIEFVAPLDRPGKIFAIGLNYRDHIEESGLGVPEHQVWFTKAVTSLNGPYDPIEIPVASPYVDYEVELVAVIGRTGRHIPASQASAFVFGYCVGNDVTERYWQHQTPQWSLGKSFDTHAPIGPWITTADEVGDPHALDLFCEVNTERRQSSNTRHLVFNIWDQIAHLSKAMTLEPGDLIFTGTPGGIGAAMEPRQFLKAGDRVRCGVSGLGEIEAVCVNEIAWPFSSPERRA